ALLAHVAFILINLGIWLVVAGTTFQAVPGVLLAGRVVEVGAIIFFALHVWNRVVTRDAA
ncbi:MAG: hypothetical protein KDE51_25750, partial [Anaerolineales bacterium]|nr:hypothetical protein [Anaerolineales bacterium]